MSINTRIVFPRNNSRKRVAPGGISDSRQAKRNKPGPIQNFNDVVHTQPENILSSVPSSLTPLSKDSEALCISNHPDPRETKNLQGPPAPASNPTRAPEQLKAATKKLIHSIFNAIINQWPVTDATDEAYSFLLRE
ncbi:hypothetical protein H0H87_011482 [Tephrocybe sp. NHM501043]|nr:hypothetical protein H0H87_011482 [Tephrocybe sp. NHM501043]